MVPPVAGNHETRPTAAVQADTFISGERREISVLFADLVSSTSMGESLGDEVVYAVTKDLFGRLVAAIEARGGRLAEFSGDGVMALFGGPVVVDDAPLVACRTAVDLRRLTAESSRSAKGLSAPLQLRIGISTGMAVVGMVGLPTKLDLTAIGDTVNLAARLERMAGPGEILIDVRTHELVANTMNATALGAQSVRGRKGRVAVYRLERTRPGVSRFLASSRPTFVPLVGRASELQTLMELAQAGRSARRFVGIAGDAGIGKSRLLNELLRSEALARAKVLTGHCLPDSQQTPYLPIIDILHQLIAATDENEVTIELAIREALARCDLLATENVTLVKRLIGLVVDDASGTASPLAGLHLRDLLFRWLEAVRAKGDTALAIEDIHWMDEPSRDLLLRLAQEGTSPGLIIWTTRNGDLGTSGIDAAVTLRLTGLGESEVGDLVRRSLAVEQVPDRLTRFLMEKSEGNPLFVTAILDHLVDRGDIQQSGPSATFSPTEDEASPPGTLQNLIMQRIDKLPREQKALLQAASVCGRSFSLALIAQVVEAENRDEVLALLLAIADRGLIVRASSGDDPVFGYAHSLVRDAVYATLLLADRAAIHQRVGEILELDFASRGHVDPAVLAFHFGRTPLTSKAVHYLAAAGNSALSSYSLAAAERLFRSAADRIDRDPTAIDGKRLAALLASWMRVLELQGRFYDIRRLAQRHLSAIEGVEQCHETGLVLSHLAHALAHEHAFEDAKATVRRAIHVGEAIGDEVGIAHARLIQIKILSKTRRGLRETEVQKLGAAVLATAAGLPDGHLELVTLMELANDRMHRGALASARDALSELQAVGERRKDPRAQAFALWMLGWLDLQEGNYSGALANAELSLKSTLTRTDALVAGMVRGAATALLGNPAAGVAQLSEIRLEAVENRDFNIVSAVDSALGVAHALDGRLARGVKLIKRSIRRGERTGYSTSAAYGRLVLAEVYVALASRSSGPKKLAVLLRNLPFLLRALPVSRRKATGLISEVIASEQFERRSVVSVRCNIALFLVSTNSRKKPDADLYLDEAHNCATELGLHHMTKRIQGIRDQNIVRDKLVDVYRSPAT